MCRMRGRKVFFDSSPYCPGRIHTVRLAPGAVFGAQFTGVADSPRRFREQMGEWPAYEPAGCNNILGLSVHLRLALRRLYGA
jgi:hypothetical protein